MNYRGHKLTLQQNGWRWRIDDPTGRLLATRPSQSAACAFIDQYLAEQHGRDLAEQQSVLVDQRRKQR